jgi:hypothetical protein
MNRKGKGQRTRLECMKALKEHGWLVDVIEKTSRFAKVKDCFGFFDVIAVSGNQPAKLIQVTCESSQHPHKKYLEFAMKYTGVQIEQWVKRDRKGFIIYAYGSDGDIKAFADQ